MYSINRFDWCCHTMLKVMGNVRVVHNVVHISDDE
jgi:hypothetical protein